ncbi:MAG: glycosyltransferase family 2 protein [Candidatus Daviesbacteria bacterium]|nr:glycosyltransferase family 2 protein [Candidatus Daviesbacteria bacterium]
MNNPNISKIKNYVSLIIPVLNEEATLESIIKRCSKQNIVKQLVIVNDGSTDKTKQILSKTSKTPSKNTLITVVHHKQNLGKGAAIKTGLQNVFGKYVMVQDADLEYAPEEIINLFNEAQKSRDGIVFGTRTRGKNKGYLLAQLGNWYLNMMFNILFGYKLTDSYTCYKLIPKQIWQEAALESEGFEIDSELIAKLGVKKYKIAEIPISYNPRKYSEGKKIKWWDLVKATLAALDVRFKSFFVPLSQSDPKV